MRPLFWITAFVIMAAFWTVVFLQMFKLLQWLITP